MSLLLADIDATCAALGLCDGDRYLVEPGALQCLKHLIWILRRDLEAHDYRRHLGHAEVLQTDLVPMLCELIDNEEYADVLIRLMVILTNPVLLLYRDGPPKDFHGRKVFLELIDVLQGYKKAYTGTRIWEVLCQPLKKAFDVDWALRSEDQNLLIERILVLVRNVLQVPANTEAEGRTDNDASVHDQVIWAMHRSGLLDLLRGIVVAPDEQQFHLHALEILCLLYREQTAESLADASMQRSIGEKQRDEQELLAARRRERQRHQIKPPAVRHSRFGGTYVIRNMKSVSDRDIICHQPLERVVTIDFDREKAQQKRSFRHVREEAQLTRRSAFAVRMCLREYCVELLNSAFGNLVRQVRRVVERNAGTGSHDDSYLLWLIRFFMEFNRLSGQPYTLVSESLSVQCFHWVLTRMQHDMDMIVSDKKQARVWAKRLHVALQTYRELLLSLLALQKSSHEGALSLFDMLLNNVCYVLEYRETVLHLLMNYNESHSTKAYLRDVVETANVFIKMMEKFCKDTVYVQDKNRAKKRGPRKSKKAAPKPPLTEDELSNKWAEISDEVSTLLANELQLPEEDQPIPFDATAEKSIDDQKVDCMLRLHRMLRDVQLEKAISLLRAAREVWPQNDVFGAVDIAPDAELLLLREIFMDNLQSETVAAEQDKSVVEDEVNEEDEENEEFPEEEIIEKPFKFEDFVKRLLNPKIVRACTIVLSDWETIPTKSLKATVTILHRIAYGCSCPAMLYQAKLFRIFQRVLAVTRDTHHEELRRLAIYVVRKFVETATTNPKIYAELLFYKTVREANELESGYCDAYEAGTKGAWNEEQELELRMLFEENQRNPATDMDVIDWILNNITDKTRTRRGILKKLKDLGLQFSAPTKRSTASGANKHLWSNAEDEELQSLYDQHRLEEDCLQRIVAEFTDRRSKRAIIKRMLQLHIIADKSEILPKKQRKRKSKKKATPGEDSDSEDGRMEEPQFGDDSNNVNDNSDHKRKKSKKVKKAKPAKTPKPIKTPKPVKRKIVRTPLHVATVRALLSQVDGDKYAEAIDWLKECLTDAADDEPDAGAEDDDGVPLVPLQQCAREAVEDAQFQKLLVALGMQPPIVGVEQYWRIPIYLNGADLQLRAKIVGGEQVDVDLTGIENVENGEEVGAEATEELTTDGDTDSEATTSDSDSSAAAKGQQSDSEEDFFDNFAAKQRQRVQEMTLFKEKRAQKMNLLMFTKSDDEMDKELPAIVKKKSEKSKEPSTDEADFATEIKRKLDKKRRQPGLLSSDDDDGDDDANDDKGKTVDKKAPNPTLFDQLKTQNVDSQHTLVNDEFDELNFNSEDYRKRLLELGDSDEDVDAEVNHANVSHRGRARRANVIDSDSEEDDAVGVVVTDATVATDTLAATHHNDGDVATNIVNAAAVIDSVYDKNNKHNFAANNKSIEDGENVAGVATNAAEVYVQVDDIAAAVVDKTSNQPHIDDGHIELNKKRRRHASETHNNDSADDTSNLLLNADEKADRNSFATAGIVSAAVEDADGVAAAQELLSRKAPPTVIDKDNIGGNHSEDDGDDTNVAPQPAKRRRFAVIVDDDEDE